MTTGQQVPRRARLWRRALGGGALAAVAGALAYRQIRRTRRGRSSAAAVDSRRAIQVRRVVTVRGSPDDLYRWWRRLENLPRIMRHLRSVTETTATQSHWVAGGPAGLTIEWDAEVIQDVPGERVAWKAVRGEAGHLPIAHAGSVRFRPAPDGRGTEVHVELSYEAAGGPIAPALAKLMGEDPDAQIREDLRRFKQRFETGEVPTIEGQPRGGA